MTNLLDDYKAVLTGMWNPDKFAKQKSMTLGDGLAYFFKGTAIPVIIFLIEIILFGGLIGSHLSALFGGVAISGILAVAVLLYWLIIIPVALLIDSALIHLVGKYVLKFFKGTYSQTFTALIYGETAVLSLLWFFPALLLSGLFGIIIEILALANQQKTTGLKALSVFVVIIVVAVALRLLVFAFR